MQHPTLRGTAAFAVTSLLYWAAALLDVRWEGYSKRTTEIRKKTHHESAPRYLGRYRWGLLVAQQRPPAQIGSKVKETATQNALQPKTEPLQVSGL